MLSKSDYRVGVKIEGLDEILADLDRTKINGADRALRRALRAAGKVVQAAIVSRTPIRLPGPSSTALPVGAMIADINVSNVHNDAGHYSIDIGPGKHTAHVAMFVEYGHEGPGGKGKPTPAEPFLRPAWEESEAPAVAALIEELETQTVASLNGAVVQEAA